MKPLDRLALGAAHVLTLAAAVTLIVGACASPAPSPSAQAPTATPAVSAPGTPPPVSSPPSPTPPAETDVCVPERAPTPPDAGPCPQAIAAVRAAVAPLGLPIARIVLQPRPFDCGRDLWPGVGSPMICFGVLVITGTTMHGWVAFVGSDKVAAVSLGLQPATGPSPAPSPMWVATIVAFQVPPAGWLMP